MSNLRERQTISVRFKDIFYISNILSSIRIVLVPFIIYFILIKHIKIALAIATVAMVADSFDGYLARKLNQTSDLGRIIDPIADKLLLNGIFISLLISERQYMPPIWAITFIVSRDILIFIGNLYLGLHAQTIISADVLSKTATVLICLTIGSYILAKYFYFLKIPFLSSALIFSAASAVSYGIKIHSALREKSKEIKS